MIIKYNLRARKILANNIIFFRLENEWSQEDFADKLGTTPTYVSTLENAKRNTRIDYIGHIADTLGVSIEQLFKERPNSSFSSIVNSLTFTSLEDFKSTFSFSFSIAFKTFFLFSSLSEVCAEVISFWCSLNWSTKFSFAIESSKTDAADAAGVVQTVTVDAATNTYTITFDFTNAQVISRYNKTINQMPISRLRFYMTDAAGDDKFDGERTITFLGITME